MTVDVGQAVLLSLSVATASTLAGLVPAVALGRWLATRERPYKPLVTALLLVPLVLPPVVTGLLLLDLFGRDGPLGALGLPFTWLGAVVAALVVGFPLYVIAVRQAFEAVDPRYEEVALTLGDPPWRAFRRVALPLALPGIAAGAVLAFARGLGEFGATVILAGNIEGRTRTIALAVYTLLDAPGRPAQLGWLVGASLLLAAVSLGAYEALLYVQRRRLEVRRG